MDLKFLKEMIDTPSLSGNEYELQKKIIKHMEPLCDKVITDHVGNVVSVINPESKVKILLDAHIDEIGLIIEQVLDNGICKVPYHRDRKHGILPCEIYRRTFQCKTDGCL